jgi:hypothetical protein
MRFARSMTPLAADIPFGNGLGCDIEVHGMATVAERSGRALEIVRRVKRGPPVGAIGYKIGSPHLVRDIPLGGKHKVVVPTLLK